MTNNTHCLTYACMIKKQEISRSMYSCQTSDSRVMKIGAMRNKFLLFIDYLSLSEGETSLRNDP